MRQIELIKGLEFNKVYKDEGGYTAYLDKQMRSLYEAEEIVSIDPTQSRIVDRVTQGYEDIFKERKITPTSEQLDFANTTAKILLGELHNDNTVPVIPAPCGFGKSTITYVFLKEVCNAIKQGTYKQGLIIVTDKLKELKEIHKFLNDEVGGYKEEFKTPFTYVLEGWTENSFSEGICSNERAKFYSHGMCSSQKCPFFTDCKMSKQKNNQMHSPILLMTNARLETFGESIQQYNFFIDKDGNKQPRTMIINDEKPKLTDARKVSVSLINEIENELDIIPFNTDISKMEKNKLILKWRDIRTIVVDKLRSYAERYDRFLISNKNNNPILLNDKEFVKLWNKYMGNRYKRELEHIHEVLTKGGFFCNSKRDGAFISTIGMKDIVTDNFKTVIFDATALIDPDYSNVEGRNYHNIVHFIDIENARTFENVTFNFHQSHKINKSTLRTKKYIMNACVKFIEEMPRNTFTYAVTYREISERMMQSLRRSKNVIIHNKQDELWGITNKIELVTYDPERLPYFGNTKGSNMAKDCLQMVQFGWNTMPDYEYALRFLCTYFNSTRMNEFFDKCSDLKTAEKFSKFLSHNKDYRFDNPNLYLTQIYYMATDFVQEVFRTKLRDYNFNGKVDINCFQADPVLIELIKQLFPQCKVNQIKDELECFKQQKVLSRKNGDKATVLMEFVEQWAEGQQYTTKQICEATGLTVNDIDNLKRKNTYFKELFESYKVKRGTFIKQQ